MHVVHEIFLAYARRHRGMVLLSVLFVLLIPVNEVVVPRLQGRVLALLGDRGATPHAMTRAAVWACGVLLLVQCGFLLRDRLEQNLLPSLQCYIKAELLDRLFHRHDEQFAHLTSGEMVYILGTIPDIVSLWYRYATEYIVPYLITFVVATGVFLRFDVPLGLGFLAFLVYLGGTLRASHGDCVGYATSHATNMGQLHERMEEMIHNLEGILTTNRQEQEVAALRRESERTWADAFPRVSACSSRYKHRLVPLVVALLLCAVLRSVALLRSGRRSREQCVSVVVLLFSLLNSVLWLIGIIQNDIFDMGFVHRCTDVFRTPADAPRRSPMVGVPVPSDSLLGLVGVTFAYPQGRRVLHNASLHFESGQSTCLGGCNGSGKSTVLRILLGLHIPEAGDAYYDGRWYGAMGTPAVRRAIGYIPQSVVLFDRTVLENVRYGTEASEADALRLIESSGLGARLIQGAHTRVGKGGMHLSGGERQMVWCMRVLLQNPPVVVMDEPTAAMDQDSKGILLGMLSRIMAGRTVVFVTHDPVLEAQATRRIAMPG